jgi:hypothetical protein
VKAVVGGLWLGVALLAGEDAFGLSGEEARTERSVRFELPEDLGPGGLLAPGQRLKLQVHLGGEAAGPRAKDSGERIVAVFEGAGMVRVLVPMGPDRDPGKWQATAWLDLPAVPAPAAPGPLEAGVGVRPQVVRIAVSFARIRGMNLDRFAKRSVYVMVGRQAGPAGTGLTPPRGPAALGINAATGVTAQDSEVQGVAGIKDEVLVEHDLMAGSARAGDFQAYWSGIGQRIRQRWGERTRTTLREGQAKYPRVRFRLYPNGVAQTIHLERSSGSPWIDEAGLESVVDIQPFSPFPATVTDPYVNVYVDFRPAPSSR